MKKHKMEAPLNFTRDQFINAVSDNLPPVVEGKSHAVTFTLNARDIKVLEEQIDRAINFGKRNKSKSATIRMALQALKSSSDDFFMELYDQF